MRIEERQNGNGNAAGTSDQILGEIKDYCRATQTAESTFGRLVVNDGKLVSRLRDGAKITTGTLDKVRAYLSEHRPAQTAPENPSAATKPVNGAASVADIAPSGFRFFDNRQKYLLFVSTCSEKTEIANRVSLELGNLQPSPPALRLFDAGVGDGTVLSRVMRSLHARFPTMPLYVVAKEISYEDVRMMLEKMADRLFEHPATVLVVTNLYYAEAPWLTPRSVTSAQGLIWKDVALSGNTAHGFAEQIGELEGFLAENWRAGISSKTGNPVYTRPIVLTLRREDHSFLLDPIMPRPGRVMADYDLVIASQPYRARASVEFKASKVVTPLVRSTRSGPAKIHSRPIATRSCARSSTSSARPPATTISMHPRMRVRSSDITCTRCPTRFLARSEPRRCLLPGTPRSMSRRSRMSDSPRWYATAAIWKRPTAC
jgi:hypothetical protein